MDMPGRRDRAGHWEISSYYSQFKRHDLFITGNFSFNIFGTLLTSVTETTENKIREDFCNINSDMRGGIYRYLILFPICLIFYY